MRVCREIFTRRTIGETEISQVVVLVNEDFDEAVKVDSVFTRN